MRIFFLFLTSLAISAASGPVGRDIPKDPTGPECVSEPLRSAPFKSEEVQFSSLGTQLRGKIYLPNRSGKSPAIVMMHGGGNNVEIIRSTPTFMAEMLVRCGFVVLVYDKRGTGISGGDFERSTMDDFVHDAGSGGEFLLKRPEVDASRLGVVGFSQGGRLAPVVAVRFPVFTFVVSVSGPIASVVETRLYAIKQSFIEAGVTPEVLQKVLPLWEEHLHSVESKDLARLKALDSEISLQSSSVERVLLPPRSNAIPGGGIYNSMGRDYIEELNNLSVPWYSLYGAEDQVVPVSTSLRNIEKVQLNSGNTAIETKVVPNVGHSFSGPNGTFFRFDLDVITWLTDYIINTTATQK